MGLITGFLLYRLQLQSYYSLLNMHLKTFYAFIWTFFSAILVHDFMDCVQYYNQCRSRALERNQGDILMNVSAVLHLRLICWKIYVNIIYVWMWPKWIMSFISIEGICCWLKSTKAINHLVMFSMYLLIRPSCLCSYSKKWSLYGWEAHTIAWN